MNIKFEVKMTKKAMFDFMLYTSYTSLSGIVGVIFGGVTLVLGIRQCMFGGFMASPAAWILASALLIVMYYYVIHQNEKRFAKYADEE